MRQPILAWILSLILSLTPLYSAEDVTLKNNSEGFKDGVYYIEGSDLIFTPPEGWLAADPKNLPANVKIIIAGKGSKEFPPSMNLAVEKYAGDLKSYLKIVKGINEQHKTPWKDLGTIKTGIGEASLSQVNMLTEWGEVRMMHVIAKYGDSIYILTASALKSEFSKFYPIFFAAMSSLREPK